MAVNSFTAGSAVSTIIEPDEYREEVLVQWYDGGAINVDFGKDPEAGKGIRLSSDMPAVVVTDHRARGDVRVIREASTDGLGGYQTV